jgi:hypothetical protein
MLLVAGTADLPQRRRTQREERKNQREELADSRWESWHVQSTENEKMSGEITRLGAEQADQRKKIHHGERPR